MENFAAARNELIFSQAFTNVSKRKRYELQAKMYAKAFESGQSIPINMFAPPQKKHNSLNVGIIWIIAGIAIALAIWIMSVIMSTSISNSPQAEFFEPMIELQARMILSFASLGIIPFLIGVAFIIIHFIEKKQGSNENAQ